MGHIGAVCFNEFDLPTWINNREYREYQRLRQYDGQSIQCSFKVRDRHPALDGPTTDELHHAVGLHQERGEGQSEEEVDEPHSQHAEAIGIRTKEGEAGSIKQTASQNEGAGEAPVRSDDSSVGTVLAEVVQEGEANDEAQKGDADEEAEERVAPEYGIGSTYFRRGHDDNPPR
mmetsp:Transcript_20067/g.43782  ORF Transcript_20067/g.43782 Transcript_20067/m.43782 type:complete len:174 (+) Transcript_20067:662-1183(+)